jgi:hypothetical protein
VILSDLAVNEFAWKRIADKACFSVVASDAFAAVCHAFNFDEDVHISNIRDFAWPG